MSRLDAFLAMGGYAAYVWPAYATAAIVLGGLAAWSVTAYRRAQRALDRAQQAAPGARRP